MFNNYNKTLNDMLESDLNWKYELANVHEHSK